jgi:hypothetical protein
VVTGRVVLAAFLFSAFAGRVRAQDTAPPPPPPPDSDPVLTHRSEEAPKSPAPTIVPLTVPKGTPLQIALDKEVRVSKVGQPIHGLTVEPIYAFDKLVVPVGTEVTGQITELQSVSNGQRTLRALDADFSPPRKVKVDFSEIVLPDGRHLSVHTAVTPGSGKTLQFVTAADADTTKGVKSVAAEKTKQAKQQARQEWDAAMKQVKAPGKAHRLERVAVAQLPVHPQYIDAGTVYFAELQQPLDFGSEPLSAEAAASLGGPPPPGSFVHALLATPLSSASSQKGDEVEAVLSQPLFDGKRLVLPQGSRLKGTVIQVRPARSMSRGGQLRVVFHEVVPPSGIAAKVDASVEGVQSGSDQNLKLDSEGGAEARPPNTRLLTTAISVGLGAASFLGDSASDVGPRVSGGAGGFKLIGIALGLSVHSQQLGMAMGTLGASRSIYLNFIARGRDVVFSKNTAMEIGIGARQEPPPSAKPERKETVQ